MNAGTSYSDDQELVTQHEKLLEIQSSAWRELFRLYDSVISTDTGTGIKLGDEFLALFEKINDLELIFPFDWPNWEQGWNQLKDASSDYSQSSLLEVSMYITTLFQADRFNEGILTTCFSNGVFDKLFNRLKTLVNV